MAISARIRANKLHLASYIGKGIIPGLGGGATVRRGLQAGRLAIQAAAGGSSWSQVDRISGYSNEPVSGLIEADFGMASISATAGEVDWPTPLKMQLALEVAYEDKVTGLANVGVYPFLTSGGSKTAVYDGAGTLASRMLSVACQLPAGVTIPANAKFGWRFAVSHRDGGAPMADRAVESVTSDGTRNLVVVFANAGLKADNLHVGEFVQLTGMTPSTYNIKGVITALNLATRTATIQNVNNTTIAAGNPTALGIGKLVDIFPYSEVLSSYIDRKEGQVVNTSAGSVGIDFVDTNATETLAAYGALFATQSGGGTRWGPCQFIMSYRSGAKVVLCAGSSDQYGVGEGVSFSGTNAALPVYGDVLGNARRATGWAPRWVDRLGYNYVNHAKGGDGARYTQDPAVTVMRDALLVRVNPTHIVEDGEHNSLTVANPGGINPGTVVSAWSTFRVNGLVVVYIEAGTVSTVPSAANNNPLVDYQDGAGPRYRYVRPYSVTADGVAGQVAAYRMRRRARMRALVPGVKIIANVSVPTSASTDGWMTNQSASLAAAYNGNTSARFKVTEIDKVALQDPVYGHNGLVSPYAVNELAPVDESGFWVLDPAQANSHTFDGVHSTSKGYAEAAASLPDVFAAA